MRRSVLLASISAAALSSSALAQIPERHFRIGIFGFQPLALVRTGTFAPIFDELRKLGYIEGKNTTFEVRSAEGDIDRTSAIAAELVALNPDVIFASNTPSVIALKQTGTTIPVIFAQIGSDLIRLGVIESIPRPPQTIINAILDALASLGITHIDMPATPERLARDPQRTRRLIKKGQPELMRLGGGSQPKTLRPPCACDARRS
jgi:putative ABC transport system substrate-binding protein